MSVSLTYPPYPNDSIPLTDRAVQTYEHRASLLLPAPMRTPVDVRCIIKTPITLTGLQTVDTSVVLAPNDVVVPTAQVDPRQNGPWVVKASALWVRPPKAEIPFIHRTLYRAYDGTEKGFLWIVRDPEPVVVDKSPVLVEFYDKVSRFAEWYRKAEDDIWTDMNNGEHPILPHHVTAPAQLTDAKMFRALELLFRQSSDNSMDGRPDRNERMAKHCAEEYESELRMRNLQLVGGARVHPITIRVVRG